MRTTLIKTLMPGLLYSDPAIQNNLYAAIQCNDKKLLSNTFFKRVQKYFSSPIYWRVRSARYEIVADRGSFLKI